MDVSLIDFSGLPRAGFPNVELCAEPGGGICANQEGEWIPVGAERGDVIPSKDCTEEIDGESDGSADESMFHGTSGSESSGDIAAEDAVEVSINGGP